MALAPLFLLRCYVCHHCTKSFPQLGSVCLLSHLINQPFECLNLQDVTTNETGFMGRIWIFNSLKGLDLECGHLSHSYKTNQTWHFALRRPSCHPVGARRRRPCCICGTHSNTLVCVTALQFLLQLGRRALSKRVQRLSKRGVTRVF